MVGEIIDAFLKLYEVIASAHWSVGLIFVAVLFFAFRGLSRSISVGLSINTDDSDEFVNQAFTKIKKSNSTWNLSDQTQVIAHVYSSLGDDGRSMPGETRIVVDDSTIKELREMLARGEKIEAIKRLREKTGSSLVVAKSMVEIIQQQQ